MHINPVVAATLALAAASTISAAPVNEKRQEVNGNFGLTIGNEAASEAGGVSFDYTQTYKLAYANNSAYIGQIKYQDYSEPLVVSGARVAGDTSGAIGFTSYHQAPTGAQVAYIQPGVTAPLGFSLPHTGDLLPSGGVSTGFAFGSDGLLKWNGRNKFYACQNPEEAAINTYQVWWKGGPHFPVGVDCKGPVGIMQSNPCDRSN